MSYSVKEIYYTLQGEGARAGRAAVFLRFAGCNLWSGLERDRAAVRKPPVSELELLGEDKLRLKVTILPDLGMDAIPGVGSGALLVDPVGLAEPEQHLATVGHPARDSFLTKLGVRFIHPEEVLVQCL